MLEAKTHYEQVPLDIVRKIVEEQILREAAIGQGQGTKNRKLEEDLLDEQEELMPGPSTISELEL
jgi:hypothetical protein